MWTCRCIGAAAGDAGSDVSELWRACSATVQVPWVLGYLKRAWAEMWGGQKLWSNRYVGPFGLG